MEHISKPVNRVMEDLRKKREEQDKNNKKKLAIKLGKDRHKKRPRKSNPGQYSFF
jgi:hypothetical protein